MSRILTAANAGDIASIGLGGMGQITSGGFRGLYSALGGNSAPLHSAATPLEPEIDPVEQFRMEAFAQGFDEGCRVTAESVAGEAEARNRLADALELLAPAQNGTLAAMLSATVIRLVGQIVGEVEIDADLLQERCETVSAFVEESEGKSALYLHPDDIPLIEDAELGVRLAPDASMKRGCVRLDTADGWIEDGRDVRLSRLHALLDDMEGRA